MRHKLNTCPILSKRYESILRKNKMKILKLIHEIEDVIIRADSNYKKYEHTVVLKSCPRSPVNLCLLGQENSECIYCKRLFKN